MGIKATPELIEEWGPINHTDYFYGNMAHATKDDEDNFTIGDYYVINKDVDKLGKRPIPSSALYQIKYLVVDNGSGKDIYIINDNIPITLMICGNRLRL